MNKTSLRSPLGYFHMGRIFCGFVGGKSAVYYRSSKVEDITTNLVYTLQTFSAAKLTCSEEFNGEVKLCNKANVLQMDPQQNPQLQKIVTQRLK